MNGKRAKALRKVAKGLMLDMYKDLLPEGTEVTTEEALEYAPTLWKQLCRKVKKNPQITLEDLRT